MYAQLTHVIFDFMGLELMLSESACVPDGHSYHPWSTAIAHHGISTTSLAANAQRSVEGNNFAHCRIIDYVSVEQLRMCAYIGWGTEEAMVMAPCLNFHVMFSYVF